MSQDEVSVLEKTLHDANAAAQRAQKALDEHQSSRERRAAEEFVRKERAESWRKAVKFANDRVVVANKLVECLRAAGKYFTELTELSTKAYDAIPQSARWIGGASSYRLGAGDVSAVVGIDVQRAGLPDGTKISLSMLDQYPGVAGLAADTLNMIQLQFTEDKGEK